MTDANVIPLRLTPAQEYANWIVEQVPVRFRAAVLPPDPDGIYSSPVCRATECKRVSAIPEALCRLHAAEWTASGDLSVNDWLPKATVRPLAARRRGGDAAMGNFRLDAIEHPTVRAELAFGLFRRATPGRGAPVRAHLFARLVEHLNRIEAESVLDLESGAARENLASDAGSAWNSFRAILDFTIAEIHLARGDTDSRVTLGRRRGGSSRYSMHQDIPQPWLRALVRRYTEYRLNVEAASPQHVGQQETMLVKFAFFCAGRDVKGPRDITRDLLLAWGGHVNSMKNEKTGKRMAGSYRSKHFGAVQQFIQLAREEFGAQIPVTARYRRGEFPDHDQPNPRYLEPHAIDTLRAESNLALIADEDIRLVVRILIHVGLRVGHTCALPFDSLRDLNRDGTDDKWGLAVGDTKSKRNLLLPISPEVARAIRTHQERLLATSNGTPQQLFPNPRARKTGQLAPERVNVALRAWVRQLNLTEADGSFMVVTPHRFRHTFAVEMLEKGVDINVVKELLGHRSLASTQIYGVVTDKRLRAEWEKAQAVNVRGEVIEIPDGEAGDVEWLLHRVGKAVQPLGNGWCGLPIQQECPHANACLDCDNFITGPQFLPILRQQYDEHARFVSEAERSGALRLVEINQRPMNNLARIINTIESSQDA